MMLTIPTWLAFVFLGIASFAPVLNLRPVWWALYYGALLACWVLVAVATWRSVAREEQKAKRNLARVLRQVQAANSAEAGEASGAGVRRAPSEERLIIVARDQGLYDYIRGRHFGDEAVRIVMDRRGAARRRRVAAHIPERRIGERRCHDIEPLLLAQGWAEVTRPKRSDAVGEGPH